MSYRKQNNPYGNRPVGQQYGEQEMIAPQQPQQALTQMPYPQDMGGKGNKPPFVRAPFIPQHPIIPQIKLLGIKLDFIQLELLMELRTLNSY